MREDGEGEEDACREESGEVWGEGAVVGIMPSCMSRPNGGV